MPALDTRKLNVLVYAGNGTTVASVRHCLFSLRRLLAPHYAVIPVTADMLVKEPWTATCALLVVPGGADLGYCAALDGTGNRRIEQFVRRGGAFLGFCAGGYYGCRRCEFEVGNPPLEVIGNRELGFFPGTCRGGAFPGFVYHSEDGARAAELRVHRDALGAGSAPDAFRSYYNGGGVFVDAPRFADNGVEVLASYADELNVDPGEGAAAVVYCRIGDGAAVLTGPHPEFAAVNLDKSPGGPEYVKLVEALAADDESRTAFLKACLAKLGLQVAQETTAVPSLSSLHLSGSDPEATSRIVSSLQEVITRDGQEEYLKDENDTFRVEKHGVWNMGQLNNALPDDSKDDNVEGMVDYSAVVKRLVIHDELPPAKMTPYFNHHSFFSNLKSYQTQSREEISDFGSDLLYAETITSTNTILEKNPKLVRRLPHGFTATATTQVAGRGRGSNIWVSPSGALMFSTVIRHPVEKIQSSSVVFIQYLAAMAVVKGVKSYDRGYESIPIKMKWPNDVYALDPEQPEKQQYSKVCGILVNSHFSGNEYVAVVGIGVNASNPSPTTSIAALADRFVTRPVPVTLEKLLARILSSFEELYVRFLRTGFDRTFEEMYYDDWLHMDQVVTLDDGSRARVKGITRDYGLLVAQELETRRVVQLQSDSNSFDFIRGLVKRKT